MKSQLDGYVTITNTQYRFALVSDGLAQDRIVQVKGPTGRLGDVCHRHSVCAKADRGDAEDGSAPVVRAANL